MPSTFDEAELRTSDRPSADEGSRLRRNVLSFVAFLISPLQMSFLSRALGAEGFGRWWWTFVLLEIATLLGMQCADLYVRRELPRVIDDRIEQHRVVGSALVVAGTIGSLLCALQLASARWIAQQQGDPQLAVYLSVLAVQPVLNNLSAVLAAALQSINAYAGIAALRGLAAPLVTVAFLAGAWLSGLPASSVLIGLVCVTAAAFVGCVLLYRRHFELAGTLRAVDRDSLRSTLGFGLPLLWANALWVVGGKIDLYLLRPHVGPAALGLYGACLQLTSIMPNTRTVFDPVVQTQIATLRDQPGPLAESLRRLTRLCALTLLPFFVGLVTLGEPVLSFLLGRPAANAALPLAILSIGQLFGSVAVASWLAPMLLPGRSLTLLAGAALVCKTTLLLLLAPRYGAPGAALATAVGTVLAQQGMALLGSRALRLRVYSRKLLMVSAATLAGGLLSGAAQRSLEHALNAFVLGAALSGACSLLLLLLLLNASERGWLVGWVRARFQF